MKKRSIAQQAGIIRRRLKKQGITSITDYKGNEVPLEYVPNIDLIEHQSVTDLHAEAAELLERLQAFKGKVQSQGDSIYEQRMQEAGLDPKSQKGFTRTTFDKLLSIKFTRPPKYTRDDVELAIAQEYKRKWLRDEANAVPDYYMELVANLMESRDGNVDQAQLSELNKMREKIPNKNFRKMVDHFNQCLKPYYAKRYEQFIARDTQGKEQTVILSYSDVEPVLPAE